MYQFMFKRNLYKRRKNLKGHQYFNTELAIKNVCPEIVSQKQSNNFMQYGIFTLPLRFFFLLLSYLIFLLLLRYYLLQASQSDYNASSNPVLGYFLAIHHKRSGKNRCMDLLQCPLPRSFLKRKKKCVCTFYDVILTLTYPISASDECNISLLLMMQYIIMKD